MLEDLKKHVRQVDFFKYAKKKVGGLFLDTARARLCRGPCWAQLKKK